MELDKSFVITGLRPWRSDADKGTQALARALSRKHPVLYVNPPSDVATLVREGSRRPERSARGREEQTLQRIGAQLWVFTPPIVLHTLARIASDGLFDMLNHYANRRYAEAIRWAVAETKIGPFYLMIDNDLFRSFYLPELLSAELTIYLRSHRLSALPYWRRHGERLEPLLIDRCDLVLTPGQRLAEQVEHLDASVFNIGQGADLCGYDANRPYDVPFDLLGIRHPILGMTGPLGALLHSPGLLYRLAIAFPQCSFVLVGGEDGVFVHHALHRLPNVYFLGPKRPCQLPAYVSAFDVCLNPEERNEWTDTRFQEKIVHYLAMGKSVVATATDAMSVFMRHVGLATDPEHFIDLVTAALLFPPDRDEIGRRVEFARSFSWEGVVERLTSILRMLETDIAENIILLDSTVVS